MITRSEVTLIYQTNTKKTTGSPDTKTIEKKVTCEVTKTFSQNYYMALGRTMRNACNLIVNEYNTADIVDNEEVYQLTYAIFKRKKYKVENILNSFENYQDNPLQKVLDLKQVV